MNAFYIVLAMLVTIAVLWFVNFVFSRRKPQTAIAHPIVAPRPVPGWAAYTFFGLLSFSLDLTGLMDYASTIFNSLSPIVVIIGGIILGLGLLGMVLTMITRAVKLHG